MQEYDERLVKIRLRTLPSVKTGLKDEQDLLLKAKQAGCVGINRDEKVGVLPRVAQFILDEKERLQLDSLREPHVETNMVRSEIHAREGSQIGG